MALCVCGSGLDGAQCCAPVLADFSCAPTALALMRARYAAHVVKNVDFIEQTCIDEARDAFDRADTDAYIAATEWKGLEILGTTQGGPQDDTGTVDLIFRCAYDGQDVAQREIASFRRDNGCWYYKDSVINPKDAPARVEKTGRNDPCPCGSGKKHKKCCGA